MKTMFQKIHTMTFMFVLILISVMACKKAEEQLDAETIETKLSGGDSILWKMPDGFVEEGSTGCPAGQETLLLRSDKTYLYSKKGCSSSGTWGVEYTVNRTGQDLTITMFDANDGSRRVFKLQYDNNSNTFYYLDGTNGLVALTTARQLSWVAKTFSTMPSTLLGRKDMVSVEYKGNVYVGLGIDGQGSLYSDWYKFDGNTFERLADFPVSIKQASAMVKNDSIFVVGGWDGGEPNQNTYRLSLLTNGSWENLLKEFGGSYVQQRNNGVYFSLAGKEILGLGSASDNINFFTRSSVSEAWSNSGMSVFYGVNTGHNYEDALCFPLNGGYFVGGGFDGTNQTDYCTRVYSVAGNVLFVSSAITFGGLGNFSEGSGIELGDIALAYGIKQSAGYSPSVFVLEGDDASDYEWLQYTPSGASKPTPGRSTVLWKVFNPNTQKVEVYGGLGESNSGLYQLVIKQ